MVVDGLRLVRELARNHPEHLETLLTQPVSYQARFTDYKADYLRSRPIIELDAKGKFCSIRFNPHRRAPLKVEYSQTVAMLEALSTLTRLAYDPANRFCFAYQPGDCLIVDNRRVLHGREAFNSASGSRHLHVAYCLTELVEGRWQYLTGESPVRAGVL